MFTSAKTCRPSAAHPATAWLLGLAVLSLLVTSCGGGSGGNNGKKGSPGVPGEPAKTPTTLTKFENAPGVNIEITGLEGGTADGDHFQPGDMLSVTFSLKKNDGKSWGIGEMSSLRILVSGPSFNYQRVLEQQTNVAATAVKVGEGTYTYTFPVPIPDVYAPPYNDSDFFGPEDGELAGEPLLAGTYTVGMYGYWGYTVDGSSYRDVGNATFDFLLGNAVGVEPREVVTNNNCNQCHVDLQAHGGQRKEVKLCLMCHTAGAEDKNVPSVEGGTPGVTIEFKVMVHKIHNGEHLPSVLGVATNPDGSRDYDADPVPYKMVGFQNSVTDFSEIAFPIWPNFSYPMPRDLGYTGLSSAAKSQEDVIREGVTSCDKCHGAGDDFDAPAQGDLYKSQPSMRACGSCHDDVDWSLPYAANDDEMPPQIGSMTACNVCHADDSEGDPLAVVQGHTHPLHDPSFNPGVNITVDSIGVAGAGDGAVNPFPGDKLEVTFRLENDLGDPIVASTLDSFNVVVSGPTNNQNLLLYYSGFPTAALSGSSPFTTTLPERVWLEKVGTAEGAPGEFFNTARIPTWDNKGAAMAVRAVTGDGDGFTTLSEASAVKQNFIEVVGLAPGDPPTTLGFAKDSYIVIDEGGPTEEYLVVQYVDLENSRLWFGTPYASNYPIGLAFAHTKDTTVQELTTQSKALTTDYTVDATTGTITTASAFPAGLPVLATYITDFVIPETYTAPLNNSPDLGEELGDWSGKSMVDGTYQVQLWGYDTFTLSLWGESNSYRAVSDADIADFLVGAATEIEPWANISDTSNCYTCHDDIYFHGNGRRGVNTCLACHGTSGAEDRPFYVLGATPPDSAKLTPDLTVNFRGMLHKIHMGAELTNASTYKIVGFGGNTSSYEKIEFPAWPGGTKNCEICHGATNTSWTAPIDRNHPTEQGVPVLKWTAACSSCHDSDDAAAHFAAQTAPSGAESCSLCHGSGKEYAVEVMHKPR